MIWKFNYFFHSLYKKFKFLYIFINIFMLNFIFYSYPINEIRQKSVICVWVNKDATCNLLDSI